VIWLIIRGHQPVDRALNASRTGEPPRNLQLV
jgi:hypothetical protein